MKQFVKAPNKEICVDYICRKFPVLSMEKIIAGIFDRLLIREFMKDTYFQNSMNNSEADEWSTFTLIVRNFLGKYKTDNYSELMESMISFFLSTCQ